MVFALAGCEALFGIRETMGSGGAGGQATTSSSGGSAPAGSSGSGGGAGSGSGAGGPGGSGGSAATGGGGAGGAVCDSGVTPTLFCTGEPPGDFCADFDGDSGTYLTGWTDLDQDGTPAYTAAFLDSTTSHSPSGAFRVDGTAHMFDGHCNNGEAATRLAHKLTSSATGVHIDFWHRRSGGLPTTGNVQDLDLNCDDGSSTYGILNWGMRPGHYGVEVYGSGGTMSDKDEMLDAPPANQWVHVHIEVTYGTTGKVVVYQDCTKVYERDAIDTSCLGTNTKTLLFGMYTCSEVPGASVWFDDIVVHEL